MKRHSEVIHKIQWHRRHVRGQEQTWFFARAGPACLWAWITALLCKGLFVVCLCSILSWNSFFTCPLRSFHFFHYGWAAEYKEKELGRGLGFLFFSLNALSFFLSFSAFLSFSSRALRWKKQETWFARTTALKFQSYFMIKSVPWLTVGHVPKLQYSLSFFPWQRARLEFMISAIDKVNRDYSKQT